ncbi:hypothetical protein YK56LOC_33980 [Caballeronia sp. HLA56]
MISNGRSDFDVGIMQVNFMWESLVQEGPGSAPADRIKSIAVAPEKRDSHARPAPRGCSALPNTAPTIAK